MGYIFEPDVLHEVAQQAIGEHDEIGSIVEEIASELGARYPGHIRPEREWVFNNAGGAMGTMTFLHASISEYVIIFGSPIGTEGHTGRFWAEDYFIVLDGEQWAYAPGEFEREVYRPGEMHHLPRGRAQGYRIPERCWALEYARGAIPLMLPFGFADTFTSTLDVRTLAQTMKIYARSTMAELARGKL